MRVLVVLGACAISFATCDARPTRADVYFRGWYAESYMAVTPQALREMVSSFPDIKRTISGDSLQSLTAILDLQHLRRERGMCSQNTNLVVDLVEPSGARHSYRADGLYLCSIDNSLSRRTDKRFLKYFETMFPNQKT
jgi:hypothetical protein